MSWWAWLIIIILAWGFVRGKMSGKKRKPSNKKVENLPVFKSGKDIASEIKTLAHFRALEKKIERAEEKRRADFANNARGEKASEKAELVAHALSDAWDIACDKTFLIQYLPNLDLESPLETVKRAYKVFPVAKYEEKVREFGGNESDWEELRADDEPEDKDAEVKFILKFRTIVENKELSSDEISKKINSLVARNTEQASDYFDIQSEIQPAEQWRIDYTKKEL